MFCRNCGNKITPGSQFCEICGHNPVEGDNYCPECGHICIPGDEKCVGCGFPLAVSAPKQEVAPPPIPQPQTKTETAKKSEPNISSGPKFTSSGQRYCRNCGLIIPEDADKCPYCETPKNLGNNYCPSCGSGTIASDTICPVCSAKLTPVKQKPAPNYIPSAPPVQRTSQQQYQQPRPQVTVNYNPQQYGSVSSASDKSKDVAILLGILPALFGFCGIHRLYAGHIGIGLVQLFTCGMCGIWQLIDVIMILSGSFRDSDGKKLS